MQIDDQERPRISGCIVCNGGEYGIDGTDLCGECRAHLTYESIDREHDQEVASLRAALAKVQAWARLWKGMARNKRILALYASSLHAEQRAKKDAARAERDHGIELLQDLIRRVAKVEPFGTFDGLCDQIENCIDVARVSRDIEDKMIREHEAAKWRLEDAGVEP